MKRTTLLVASLVAGVALLAFAPTVASGHSGPPRSWHKCRGTVIYGGDSWQTVRGVVYAARNTATQYKVKVRPALPFGWSGTAIPNRASHPPIWIPVGTRHWFPSPAIVTGFRSGTYGVRVDVRPNPGVSNYYAVEVWAYYRCRYWDA